MIDSPSGNVKLTFEQLQQLDVVQKRLENLHFETNKSLKQKESAEIDRDTILKNKNYLQSVVDDLSIQIKGLEESRDVLFEQIAEGTKKREEILQGIVEARNIMQNEHEEFHSQKKEFHSSVEEHIKKVELLDKTSEELLQEREKVRKNKEILTKAIESVQW